MWLHELAVSDSLCRPCAGNCSPDVEVLVRALRSRLGRLNLVYVYISGQTNCSGFARRKEKPPSDLFLLVTMSGKIGEMKRGKGGLLSCVWITANCLDEERLMPHVSLSFFFIWLSLSPYLSMVTLSLFLRFSLSLPFCLTSIFPHFSLLYSLTSLFSFYPPFLPYHMFAWIASPPLSSLWSGISGI